MGTRQQRQRQEELWVATAALARPASHPFYERLNRLLDECHFDEFVESMCERFYAKTLGRSGLAPGIYFRLLMVGYFEGIDSERGMAWRAEPLDWLDPDEINAIVISAQTINEFFRAL